jgi:hypothetical protein
VKVCTPVGCGRFEAIGACIDGGEFLASKNPDGIFFTVKELGGSKIFHPSELWIFPFFSCIKSVLGFCHFLNVSGCSRMFSDFFWMENVTDYCFHKGFALRRWLWGKWGGGCQNLV